MDPELTRALAPTGMLRAAINLGNPVLARQDATTGELGGVSVELARGLARTLGVELDLVPFPRAADSVAAVRAGQADVGFFALDPARSDGLAFSAPYLLIEGAYLVRQDGVHDNAEVDVPGVRVAVGRGSAYDLFLTRTLRAAHIERVDGLDGVLAALRSGAVEVAAGIRTPLEQAAAQDGSLRMLPGRFMVIEQAMGVPAGRGDRAAEAVRAFVERSKADGSVATAIERTGAGGARVAPLS